MPRPAKERQHLYDKRRELIWALEIQGYSNAELGIIFGIDSSRVSRTINERPTDWTPKWIKVQ